MNASLGTKSEAFVYFYYAMWATKNSKRLRKNFKGLMIFFNNYYSMYSDSCAYYVQRPVL